MSVEYFISKRSAEAKSGNKPSIMVRVATISVALSVAIMIISLAIVFGFKREVSSSLTGFTSEAILTNIATLNGAQNRPLNKRQEIVDIVSHQEGFKSIDPYATLQGVVRSDEGVEGVMLRGVDSLYDMQFLLSSLTEGELPDLSSERASRDVMVSASLAQRLGLEVGGRLELIVGEAGSSLRRDLFKVCGFYSTGLDEWDRMVLIADIRSVQRLNGWSDDQISGYELRFSSLPIAARAATQINEELLYSTAQGLENIMAITSEELYPSIFDWLKAHNVNAVVVIVIMLIVAGFNMATALLIMVLERTRMIATLKSFGMTNSSLQRIFLYRALSITLNGLAWGNGVSLLLCLLQDHFKFIKLDASSYLLSHVPVEVGVGWVVLLNVAVVAAILALMVIPTRMVSKIKIEKTLKFE